MSDMPPRPARKRRPLPAPANDNGGAEALTVSCDLPENLAILSGEAELIARLLPELLKIVANDNKME